MALVGLLCVLSPTSTLYYSDYLIALCALYPINLTSTFVPSILQKDTLCIVFAFRIRWKYTNIMCIQYLLRSEFSV